jgi:phytoene dehydrogenase-like protein
VAAVRAHDEVSLDAAPASAREVVRRHLSDPLLEDMLFCPVMFYGSPTERDMDFSQFVILFKALFLEGFARPSEGVRRILRVLLAKYREAGGERRMKCGVRRILLREGRAAGVELDDGAVITADHVLSSAGAPETEALLAAGGLPTPRPTAPGRLSFVETISVLDRPPAALGWAGDTIVFFSEGRRFDYVCPEAPVDVRSGVICLPNNFAYEPGEALAEGWFRVTSLARPEDWAAWPEPEYRARKQEWFGAVQASARRFLPPVPDADLAAATVATDMFTPRTITRFTGHQRGAVYGSGVKHRRGLTAAPNVYLCGTDQGFLGIVGAMLSGISMANHHILQRG